MDWAEFRARREKAPATARVPLCADGDAVRQLDEARASKDRQLRDRIPELEMAVEEATITFVVQAMPADDYVALKEQHRPKDEELRKKGHEWDEATFAPALIAACAVEPPLTPEEAQELWHGTGPGSLTLAERATLFLACRDLNETIPDLGFTRPGTD